MVVGYHHFRKPPYFTRPFREAEKTHLFLGEKPKRDMQQFAGWDFLWNCWRHESCVFLFQSKPLDVAHQKS